MADDELDNLQTDYEISIEQSDASFRRGLLLGASFVDELTEKVVAMAPEDLAEGAFNAFLELKALIINSPTAFGQFCVDDLLSYGIDGSLLNDVRLFCIQLESMSPQGISLFESCLFYSFAAGF